MIYQHVPVMDEGRYLADLSYCSNYTNKYDILGLLKCIRDSSSSNCKCTSITSSLEIIIVGKIINYKFQKNSNGLWESEMDYINNSEVSKAAEIYFRNLWSWKKISYIFP